MTPAELNNLLSMFGQKVTSSTTSHEIVGPNGQRFNLSYVPSKGKASARTVVVTINVVSQALQMTG
jgi:hypothetical protein